MATTESVFLDLEADLFDMAADALCITTNGDINKHDRAVMGRGCAEQAAKIWIGIDVALAKGIRANGNVVNVLKHPDGKDPRAVLSLPVKHHWNERADIGLIASSLADLVSFTDWAGWTLVVLPRPGCGNGKLNWEREVREVCEAILDERFVVVHREGK